MLMLNRFNLLIGTGNCSATSHIEKYEIDTLAVDGWAVTFGKRGVDWAGPQPAQDPPRCTKCIYSLL